MSCLSFDGTAISLSEIRADATDNLSAEFFKEHLQLFGDNIALYVYYLLLHYNPCSTEGDK